VLNRVATERTQESRARKLANEPVTLALQKLLCLGSEKKIELFFCISRDFFVTLQPEIENEEV
jgi:hypothetical protein